MSDGHLNKCKECTKIDTSSNYKKNIDHYRAYDKERNKSPERISRVYQFTKKWRQENPLKYKAHILLNNAVRDGKVIKGNCEVCNSNKVHAHHFDYNQPLNVQWLCPEHHSHEHKVILCEVR